MSRNESSEKSTIVDLVCGMKLHEHDARHTAEYRNEKYYFCSAMCRSRFDSDPEKYLASSSPLHHDVRTDHQHTNDHSHDMRMMWMMMLACMIPIVVVGLASSSPNRLGIVLVVVMAMIATHLILMRGRRHTSDETRRNRPQEQSRHDEHTGCH